jgi:oxygen-independent coproporphyrinogen-3 oxidase
MEPQAAYIHVPFCARRCGYCNFTVVAGRDDLIDAYLTALERELSALERPRPVETLFVGGGTPTHLSPQQLERLMHVVRRWFPLAKGGEFSVEANPADVDRATVDVLAESGVNRLSLGVQSFDENKLSVLERDHRADRVEQACELAREAFSSVSLDVIFAVPGETLVSWRRDLALTLQQTPNHVSSYGLTFDRGARFLGRLRRGDLSEIDEETQRAMYETTIDTLVAAGFEHYEVSNFARPGHRCRHNEIYWSGREYYAAGPGAARYVAGVREQNHGSTFTYLKRVLRGDSPVVARERLSPEDTARERLVFGLRMLRGIECDAFERDTGFDVDQLGGQELSRYLEMGFLEKAGKRLRLTRDGLMISDSLWPGLLRV